MNKEALKAYKKSSKEIQNLLKILSNKISADIPSNLNDVHWGHVGSMSHIKNVLAELVDNIN